MGRLAASSWHLFETLLALVFYSLLTVIATVGFRRLISLGIAAVALWWIASAVLG